MQYLIISGLLLTLFIPFYISNSLLFPFIAGKGFAFRIIVEILFGLWLTGMVWESKIRPRFSWILGAILVFLAAIMIADLHGFNPYKSFWSSYERMEGLNLLLHLGAYFIVLGSVLNTRLRWNIFLNSTVVTSVIMSFYAFFQLAGKIRIDQGDIRVDGTLGNAGYMAVYMLMSFFITLFLLLRVNKQRINWLLTIWYVIAGFLQVFVLYKTATRGDIIGLIGGVVLCGLIVAIWEKERTGVRKLAYVGLAIVVLVIGGFFSIRHTAFVQNNVTLSRLATISLQEFKTEGRRYIWPMALQGFKEHPILGYGQENFTYVFNKYYDPRMYNQEAWFDRAHDIVLDWLIAGGLLGLLSYFGIFAALLWLIWRSKRFSLVDKAVLISFTAAYFVQNLFVFDNLVSYMYFFILLAFVHAESTAEMFEPGWLARKLERPISRVIIPVAAIAIVCVAVYSLNMKQIFAGQEIINGIDPSSSNPDESIEHFKKAFSYKTFGSSEAAEHLLNQSSRFRDSSLSQNTVQNYISLAISEMDAQINRVPNDARYLLFMGSFRNRLGDSQNALPYLERALKLSPNKQSILFETGFVYLSTGKYQPALALFKKTYELEPHYVDALVLYGVSALYAKQDALASQLFAKLDEPTFVNDERILAAYYGTGHTDQAVKILQRRQAIDPDSAALRFRLASAYLALGQRPQAVKILQQAEVAFPEVKNQADYYIKQIQAGKNK